MDCSNKGSQIELSGHAKFLKYEKIPLKMCVLAHAFTHTHTLPHSPTHTVFTLTQIHIHILEDPTILQNGTFNTFSPASI